MRVARYRVRVPQDIPVIDLSKAPGQRDTWDRRSVVVYMWAVCELLFVSNPWQVSSALRVRVLRAFGATIGEEVILRPRLRVRFPWKLSIGSRSWIGEDVWLHNQDELSIGADVVVSQGTFITTGSHRKARDMGLVTKPVIVHDGVWITARCVVLGGSVLGRSSLVLPNTVVRGAVPEGMVFGTPGGVVVGPRFQ